MPAVTRDAAGVVRLEGFSDNAIAAEVNRRGLARTIVAAGMRGAAAPPAPYRAPYDEPRSTEGLTFAGGTRRPHSFVPIEAAPSHCHVCGRHRDWAAHAGG